MSSEETSASVTFENYDSEMGENVNAIMLSVENVEQIKAKSHEVLSKISKSDELKKWDKINLSMNRFVRLVQWVAQLTIEELDLVLGRLGNMSFMTLAQCYGGFDPNKASSRFEELRRLGDQISEDIKLFLKQIERRLSAKDRKHMKMLTGALVVTVALCIVLCTPAICAEAPVLVIRGAKIIAGVGAVTTIYQGKELLRCDKRRATAYLRDIELNHSRLSKSVDRVNASTKAFTALNDDDDREFIKGRVAILINQYENLNLLCDAVIAGPDESGWCTIL
eukprot:CAMPEP_0204618674 /NCGR_PEP_ID=MMETSP0717-20131115/5246_1 /ASSEMBLY_ACC=CAM_ASM_000666 /TAXON_ID=230516 /ORGANISM="Chaetoceros curvisetus" /LENGTH=279 /DNA_ID=CAMNT_0051632463 /DNA_START=115 /DNA_END=954 /DNA_ORIENTATION=+